MGGGGGGQGSRRVGGAGDVLQHQSSLVGQHISLYSPLDCSPAMAGDTPWMELTGHWSNPREGSYFLFARRKL